MNGGNGHDKAQRAQSGLAIAKRGLVCVAGWYSGGWQRKAVVAMSERATGMPGAVPDRSGVPAGARLDSVRCMAGSAEMCSVPFSGTPFPVRTGDHFQALHELAACLLIATRIHNSR
jgi:hypothetical protein